MKKFKSLICLLLALTMVFAISACGKEEDPGTNDNDSVESNDDGNSSGDEVRTIQVAFSQGNKPYSYFNENDEIDGYEIKVLQRIDEMLPQYEFEFNQTSFDDLSTGVTTGKYQIGLSGSFKTPAREEQMLFPDEYLGASGIGLILRKEDADCDTLRKCVEKGLKMTAIAPSDGMWVIVEDYNNNNPDAPLEMETAEIYTLADFYIYVAEGRYDYTLIASAIWDSVIADPEADLHYLEDQLVQYEIAAVPTWTLLNKDETELADAISDCLKELKEDGTLEELMVEYFGKNYFELIVE